MERRILALVHKRGTCTLQEIIKALPGSEQSARSLFEGSLLDPCPTEEGHSIDGPLKLGNFSLIFGWQEGLSKRRILTVLKGLDPLELDGVEAPPNFGDIYWRSLKMSKLQQRVLDILLGDPFEQDTSRQIGIIRATLLPPYEDLAEEAKDYLDAYWRDKKPPTPPKNPWKGTNWDEEVG